MKKFALFILICFWAVTINAQINTGGNPHSFEKQIKAKRIIKNKTDKIVLPPIEIYFLATESVSCPTLTKGQYRYDFGDTAHQVALAEAVGQPSFLIFTP